MNYAKRNMEKVGGRSIICCGLKKEICIYQSPMQLSWDSVFQVVEQLSKDCSKSILSSLHKQRLLMN